MSNRRSRGQKPLIKVTLESLKGIKLKTRQKYAYEDQFTDVPDLCKGEVHKKAGSPRIPQVTAAISFSGSASDMQVGSSSLCPRTGNLLVESEPACLVAISPSSCDDASSDGDLYPLVAHWDGTDEAGASSRASSSKKPHLTIRLPSRDPRLPSASLEQMNRDCNIVHSHHRTPGLEGSDLSSSSGEDGADLETDASDDASQARGPSVIWSASGSVMPEIIELNVSLTVGNDDAFVSSTDGVESTVSPTSSNSSWAEKQAPQEGVAYLVFFGHDKVTTMMDLPVKKHPSQKPVNNQEGEAIVTLDDEAMLRIRVDVLPNGREDKPNMESVYSMSLLDSFVGRKRLEPILQQLRQESDQQQRLEDRKDDVAEKQKQEEEAEEPRLSFCAGDTSFFGILKRLTEALKYCDDGGVYVQSGESVASTLYTSPSLGI